MFHRKDIASKSVFKTIIRELWGLKNVQETRIVASCYVAYLNCALTIINWLHGNDLKGQDPHKNRKHMYFFCL